LNWRKPKAKAGVEYRIKGCVPGVEYRKMVCVLEVEYLKMVCVPEVEYRKMVCVLQGLQCLLLKVAAAHFSWAWPG
jgi:hypothetical protein